MDGARCGACLDGSAEVCGHEARTPKTHQDAQKKAGHERRHQDGRGQLKRPAMVCCAMEFGIHRRIDGERWLGEKLTRAIEAGDEKRGGRLVIVSCSGAHA